MHRHFAATDVAAATRELAMMFQSALDTAGVRLVVDCPALSDAVWIDQDVWEKFIPNLVSKAFKFTREGEIAGRVRDSANPRRSRHRARLGA